MDDYKSILIPNRITTTGLREVMFYFQINCKPPHFGFLLKFFRKKYRWTQRKLAEALPTADATIGHWEREFALPSTITLIEMVIRLLGMKRIEARVLVIAYRCAILNNYHACRRTLSPQVRRSNRKSLSVISLFYSVNLAQILPKTVVTKMLKRTLATRMIKRIRLP